MRPSVARAHRVHQVAPNGVLPYDDWQFDFWCTGPRGVRARGRRIGQALYEQELLDVGPPVVAVVHRAVAATGPVPETVPPVLERRLRRRGPGRGRWGVTSATDTVPVVHVQADGPVQRQGRRGRRHFQMVPGGGHSSRDLAVGAGSRTRPAPRRSPVLLYRTSRARRLQGDGREACCSRVPDASTARSPVFRYARGRASGCAWCLECVAAVGTMSVTPSLFVAPPPLI